MAFFLLGRTADGAATLLSDQTFESRQDALAQLGHLTADPSFDRWDDEVLLVDFETATPILLVRPTTPSAAPELVIVDTVDAEPESSAFAAMADEASPSEPAADATSEPAAEPDFAAEGEVSPESAPELELEVPAVAEPEAQAATEPGDETDTGVSLRDAIARTTEQMEASGIVAPASIGPAQAEEEVEAEDVVQDAATEDIPATEEPSPAATPEPPSWPWSTFRKPAPDFKEAEADAAAADVAFVLEGLEEPSIDEGSSLITSTIDTEKLAASGPVILGAYKDESGADAVQGAAAEGEAGDAAAVDAAGSDADSDFIELDPAPPASSVATEPVSLGTATPPTGRVAEPAVAADDILSLSAYTCADCVYVETCPNKDQRRPEDCGSFQWK